MQFTSLSFLLFFPAVCAGAFVLPARWRRGFLLLCSLVFYLYGAPRYGVFLLCSIGIIYACARLLPRVQSGAGKKGLLAAGLLCNLGFLLFFKYYDFAAQNLNALLALLGRQNPLPLLNVALPVGISFYTFQSLGYVLDVYRGQTPPEKNIVTYALFVAFFPQIQSGPIGRSTTLLPQFQAAPPPFSFENMRLGLCTMLWGFFKKLVIADRLAVFVAGVFDSWQQQGGAVLLCAVLLFTVQIYCDFSGYTSIATGAARVLGYRLDANFNFPYFSQSIAEFWRRWHISLSFWFRDYLFYPLLRSRPLMALAKALRGRLPKYYAKNLPVALALLVLWLATGLWHGAAWGYVAFGLWHGGIIILSTLLQPLYQRAKTALRIRPNGAVWHWFGVLRTFLLVNIGFVFFRAGTVQNAFGIFKNIAGGLALHQLWDGTLFGFGISGTELLAALLAIALLAAAEWLLRKRDLFALLQSRPLPLRWAVYLAGLLLVVIFGMYGEGYVDKPFIYFQF